LLSVVDKADRAAQVVLLIVRINHVPDRSGDAVLLGSVVGVPPIEQGFKLSV
jgi:hypothetical protein